MYYEEMKICNILQWHQAGYTGKNIAIDVLEHTAKSDHGNRVQYVLAQIAPDAKLRQKAHNYPAFQNSKANLINISLNASQTAVYEETRLACIKRGITIVDGVGNRTPKFKEPSKNAKLEHAISVGAIRRNPSIGENYRWAESLYDDRRPTTVAYIGVLKKDRRKLIGTSFAAPWVVGMLALWFQWHMDKRKELPTHWESKEFILKNSRPLGIEGTGAGLFILPELTALHGNG